MLCYAVLFIFRGREVDANEMFHIRVRARYPTFQKITLRSVGRKVIYIRAVHGKPFFEAEKP